MHNMLLASAAIMVLLKCCEHLVCNSARPSPSTVFANDIIRYCTTLHIQQCCDLSSTTGGVLSSCFQFEHCIKEYEVQAIWNFTC